jgi:chemotaxis protein CheD
LTLTLPVDLINGLPVRHVFLMPGALHCSSQPSMVTTVLGSCVAVCLWDHMLRCGGINHYVLPRCGEDLPSLRYGDYSIRRLMEAMLRLGSSKEDLEAKIFGGAAVLPVNAPENNVGTKNVELALERMHSLCIPIVARRTGGECGISLRMFTETGAVLVRSIAPSMVPRIDGGCGYLSERHPSGKGGRPGRMVF